MPADKSTPTAQASAAAGVENHESPLCEWDDLGQRGGQQAGSGVVQLREGFIESVSEPIEDFRDVFILGPHRRRFI
jgi:hypothetical protein